MMDQTTAWFLALLILIIAFGVYLRRRYGNLYARFSGAVEHTTGFQMTSIVRGIGILTLVAWVVVYLLSGLEQDTGLKDLFEGPAGRLEDGEGQASGPRLPRPDRESITPPRDGE